MNESKLPPELEEKLREVAFLLPQHLLLELRDLNYQEVLELLAVSMEATEEALLLAKSRFFTGSMLLGELDAGTQVAELDYIQESYRDYRLFQAKLNALNELHDCVVQKRRRSGPGRLRALPQERPPDGAA